MKERNSSKLWVVKLCLKIVYPKFNYYVFLVFLAIKYRYYYNKGLLYRRNMKAFKIDTVPVDMMRHLAKDLSADNSIVLLEKCVVVPKKHYIDMTVDNLFYQDNGVLWVLLKLSPNSKKQLVERERNENKNVNTLKYNLNFVTEELHRRLWHSETSRNYDNARIVPIVGSNLVKDNICITTENEFHNIVSSFDLNMYENVEISFYSVPSFENAPKIAAIAEVNLIVNDYDLSNDFLKEVLSNYFLLPKLVSIGDIISIDLDPKVTAKYHYKYLDLIESVGKLYFKCRKLSSDTNEQGMEDKIIQAFYIVKGVTQLSLGEVTHVIKPKNEFFKVPHLNYSNILHLCPTGLREKFDQIQETIMPFLTGEINALSSSMSSPIIPMLLLTGSLGSGTHLLVKILAKYNGLNCLQADCNALQSSTAKQTESKINSIIQKAKAAAPAIISLDNFEVFAVDPENNEDQRVIEYFLNSITDLYLNYTKHPIIFIAITERVELKPNIMRIFLEKFHIPRLNVQQRYEMLEWFAAVMQINIGDDVIRKKNKICLHSNNSMLGDYSKEVLQRVASKTETYAYGDLDTLVHFAMRESYLKQHNCYFQLPRDPGLQDVQEEDFNAALESIRSLQSQQLDAPKIPKVYWDDIGGLDKLKKELLKTIEFPIKFPHLFKNSTLKRSGILLYGPPGCGKTLVAKAVSTELNVSFVSVKGPELLNMYIGQSEENVRKVFESARACSPCIVFLDELDALAPRRGAAGDSGGASDRVVSQLLAELDGVASGEDADTSSFVFIMGATNRPDLLEQSLLRPGRLDKLIYVGPYNGRAEKTCVLKALCRSYKVRPEVNLEDIALALPESCTGADLLQVVSTARSAAVRELVAKLHNGVLKESELSMESIILGASELLQGVESFRPSVSEEELLYYESLQTLM